MNQRHQPGDHANFPSPDERERIIERRSALSYALHLHLVLQRTDPAGTEARRQELIHEYGLSEVQRMQDRIGRHFQAQRPTGDAEEEWLYQNYVVRYRRWGGQRPLLQMEEERRLNYERTILKTRQDYHAGRFSLEIPMRLPPLSAAEERRLSELTDLLLADVDLWDDLVPEDPPAPAHRTSDNSATTQQAQTSHSKSPVFRMPDLASRGKPGRNEPCWCGSGRKYKHCHLYADQARS